jgi:hypothetical protein
MLLKVIGMDGWTEPLPDQGSLLVKRKVRSGSTEKDKAFASVLNMSRQEIVRTAFRILLNLMLSLFPMNKRQWMIDAQDSKK